MLQTACVTSGVESGRANGPPGGSAAALSNEDEARDLWEKAPAFDGLDLRCGCGRVLPRLGLRASKGWGESFQGRSPVPQPESEEPALPPRLGGRTDFVPVIISRPEA